MIKMNQMPPGASEEKSDQLLEHLLHGLACAVFAQPRESRGDLLQLIAAVEEYQLPAPDFSTTTQHTMAVLFAPPVLLPYSVLVFPGGLTIYQYMGYGEA